jgi:hypothetical protein
MKKYLLQENGSFYKANLHCHSTFSDGHLTPEEIKELYKKLGYSIVAYTDHDILIPHDELNDDEFLALHGFEIEINDNIHSSNLEIMTCHICFIGIDPDNITQPFWNPRYLFSNAKNYADFVKHDDNEPNYVREYTGEAISTLMQGCRDKGFFVTYNHPTWSLEAYPQYMSYNGMHAFEMYNGGCLAAGFADYHPRVYDDMLMGGKKLYCIGADDNHNHADPTKRRYDSGWSWTMIKADSLAYRDVTKALVNGQFYASEGAVIEELTFEDGRINVKCGKADRIICNYGVRHAEIMLDESGDGICEATFAMKPEWKYFRITVINKDGKTACTNAYFADDFFAE